MPALGRSPLGSTFDRYLLREFSRFFALALTGFVLFVLLFDAFEKIDTFIDHRASAGQILRYYLTSTPYRAVLVCPVAVLLATFLTLGYMTRFHEITVMRSAGISLYRLLVPLYIAGILIAATNFTVSEFVMPGAQTESREILNVEIKGKASRNLGSRLNVTYLGGENRIYVIRRYDVPNETMVDVTVQEFEGDRLARRIDAKKAVHADGAWIFVGGVERSFAGAGTESAVPFDSLRLAASETPDDFAKQEVRPEQMSFPELIHYAKRVRQSGGRPERIETDLHLRIAFPLINFVILLIGASLAVIHRRGGVAVGFGFSLLIAFGYWSLIRAGQVLGQNGTLPPMLGAWLGNLVFLALGGTLLYRTPK